MSSRYSSGRIAQSARASIYCTFALKHPPHSTNEHDEKKYSRPVNKELSKVKLLTRQNAKGSFNSTLPHDKTGAMHFREARTAD